MYIAGYGSESEKGNCRQGIGCKLCGMRRAADTQVELFFELTVIEYLTKLLPKMLYNVNFCYEICG